VEVEGVVDLDPAALELLFEAGLDDRIGLFSGLLRGLV
jgi:hypothetical protein